jgi:DNA-binding response OmpR family regulator
MPYRVLVVEPGRGATVAELLAESLEDAGEGYDVLSARGFAEAAQQIEAECPDVVITAVRLEAFNGMHLLLRSRRNHPNLPFVLMNDVSDPVLSLEASHYGAPVVTRPVDAHSLRRVVSDLLAGPAVPEQSTARRWPRKHAELSASVMQASVRVVDMSYGGLRLEFSKSPEVPSSPINVVFPTLGLSVTALPKWRKALPTVGSWLCGAEVAAADSSTAWRGLVDSLE